MAIQQEFPILQDRLPLALCRRVDIEMVSRLGHLRHPFDNRLVGMLRSRALPSLPSAEGLAPRPLC